jgi:hypothetical protein
MSGRDKRDALGLFARTDYYKPTTNGRVQFVKVSINTRGDTLSPTYQGMKIIIRPMMTPKSPNHIEPSIG